MITQLSPVSFCDFFVAAVYMLRTLDSYALAVNYREKLSSAVLSIIKKTNEAVQIHSRPFARLDVVLRPEVKSYAYSL